MTFVVWEFHLNQAVSKMAKGERPRDPTPETLEEAFARAIVPPASSGLSVAPVGGRERSFWVFSRKWTNSRFGWWELLPAGLASVEAPAAEGTVPTHQKRPWPLSAP